MIIKRALRYSNDVEKRVLGRYMSRQRSFVVWHVRKFSNNSGQERSIYAYSQKSSTQIPFQQLCNMVTDGKTYNARLKMGALFLKKEIPIRLAKLIGNLESLPYGLSQTNSICRLRRIYVSTFNQLVTFPTTEIEQDFMPFVELLRGILRNHRFVVPMTAMALLEMKRANPSLSDLSSQCPYLGQFLSKFFQSRIAIRLLMGHLVCCISDNEGCAGEIHHNCDFDKICQATVADVTNICDSVYGRTPTVQVKNKLKKQFTYLPGHIHVILFELLKNSCRAVCEFHHDADTLPPIQVIIAGGESDVAIKIQDEGGGIPLDQIDKIWLYTYSSARISEDEYDDKELVGALKSSLVWHKLPGHLEITKGGFHNRENNDELNRDILGGVVEAPMAGFGYGLPIARVYATLFGGTVDLKSAHGHGADTYVYLPFISPDLMLPA